MKITYRQLCLAGACNSQTALFKRLFGASVEVTEELCITHPEFDFEWASRHLLTIKQRAEYKRIKGPALVENDRVQGLAWAEYKRVEGLAWAEYERVEGPAWAEYKRVEGPAWAEYKRVEGLAWAEYERVRGLAFFAATQIKE
jgi:hypothetical protein